MKKILLFLFINFFTFFLCPQQETKRIVSEWTLDKTKILEKEDFYEIQMYLSFKIKNKSSKTIWMYDMNLWHEYAGETSDIIDDHIIKQRFINGAGISEWIGSGYNHSYPSFFEILPDDEKPGNITVTYFISKEKSPYEYFYDFNYIISNTKITPEIWENSDANKINNVFCRSFFVSFSLIDKSKTYYEDF